MKILIFLLTTLFFTTKQNDEDILELNEDSFKTLVEGNEYSLIFFYKTPCKVCDEFTEILKEVKSKTQSLATQVEIAKMNCDKSKIDECGSKLAMKFYNRREAENYGGGRTSPSIFSWLLSRVGGKIEQLQTKDEYVQLSKYVRFLVLLIGNDEQKLEIFKFTTKRFLGELTFAQCKNCEGENADVIVFSKKTGSRNEYSFKNDLNKTELINFINEHTLPLIMPVDFKSLKYIFQENHPALFLIREGSAYESAKLDTIFTKIAPQVKDMKLQPVLTDIVGQEEIHFKNRFKIKNEDLPLVVIYDTRYPSARSYRMNATINEENILQHVKDWQEGTAKRFVLSQSIPDNKNKQIIEIVGDTYNDFVNDTSKQLLLLVYAPPDPLSKKFNDFFEQAAVKLKDNPNIVLARYNGFENELFDIPEKFPQVLLWNSNKRTEFIQYLGEDKFEQFMEFLGENLK